jgi:isopentenyl phosphate kinase
VQRITAANIRGVEQAAGASHGTDVTGGMLAKIRTLFPLVETKNGPRVHLISGDIPGRLFQALTLPEPRFGTWITHE